MPKFILPGSLEVEGHTITAGIVDGAHEWDLGNVRYVSGTIPPEGVTTVEKFLFDIHANSTGCLVKGDFKMKGAG